MLVYQESWGMGNIAFPPPPSLPFLLFLSIFPVSFRKAKLEPTAKASRWTTQMGCRYGFYRYIFYCQVLIADYVYHFPDISFFFFFWLFFLIHSYSCAVWLWGPEYPTFYLAWRNWRAGSFLCRPYHPMPWRVTCSEHHGHNHSSPVNAEFPQLLLRQISQLN